MGVFFAAYLDDRCGRNGFAHHRSRVQDPVGTVLSDDSIKLSLRWCVWMAEEGFLGRVSPKTLKSVGVYPSVTYPH